MKKRFFCMNFLAAGLFGSTIQVCSVGTAADSHEYTIDRDGQVAQSLAIQPFAEWPAPLPCSSWVSLANTSQPSTPGFKLLTNGQNMVEINEFDLAAPPTAAILQVMVDDLDFIWINGQQVGIIGDETYNNYSFESWQPPPHCVFNQSCPGAMTGIFDVTSLLTTGHNVMQNNVVQRSLPAFGLDYALWVQEAAVAITLPSVPTTVPEPSTGFLMAFAAMSLTLLRMGRHLF